MSATASFSLVDQASNLGLKVKHSFQFQLFFRSLFSLFLQFNIVEAKIQARLLDKGGLQHLKCSLQLEKLDKELF